MTRPLLLALLALTIAGCSSRITYPADYPLLTSQFAFRNAPVQGRVPQGWFNSTEDTLTPTLSAWLLARDYSASISIREMQLDLRTRTEVQDEGLDLLARLSMTFRSAEKGGTFSEPESFTLGGKSFSSYEVVTPGKRARVVVFAAANRYFECEAAPAAPTATATDAQRIFRIQQSVVSSLNF